MTTADISFDALGTTVRLVLEGPGAAEAARHAQDWLARFDRCASRFRADSELCRFNDDARREVVVSPLLCATAGAGLWAAKRTEGLVDPVVVDALEAAGYAESWDRRRALDLRPALRQAPARRPASPRREALWRSVVIDPERLTITRPIGVRLDTGGTGKGLAADALLHVVGARRAVIDLGGDIALQPGDGRAAPFEIEVADPFTGQASHVLRVPAGGVATSGLDSRLWATARGPSHHLIDPATGHPAWTGLVSVTALAPSVLEAEVLAKTALLSGPGAAPLWLHEHGGLLVHDDGDVQLVGALAPRPGMAGRAGARSSALRRPEMVA